MHGSGQYGIFVGDHTHLLVDPGRHSRSSFVIAATLLRQLMTPSGFEIFCSRFPPTACSRWAKAVDVLEQRRGSRGNFIWGARRQRVPTANHADKPASNDNRINDFRMLSPAT